jgi:hypothetical protein
LLPEDGGGYGKKMACDVPHQVNIAVFIDKMCEVGYPVITQD